MMLYCHSFTLNQCQTVFAWGILNKLTPRHGVKATNFKAKAKNLASKAEDMTVKAKVKDWTYKTKDEARMNANFILLLT